MLENIGLDPVTAEWMAFGLSLTVTIVTGAALWGRHSRSVETLEAEDAKQSKEIEEVARDCAATKRDLRDEFEKRNEAMRTDVRLQVNEIWKWKQSHENDTENKRREYDRELTTLKVQQATSIANQTEILRRITEMEGLLKQVIQNFHTRPD